MIRRSWHYMGSFKGLHAYSCDEANKHNPSKSDDHCSNRPMKWVDVRSAIADGEPCNESEVKRFADPPTLYALDDQSASGHDEKEPGLD